MELEWGLLLADFFARKVKLMMLTLLTYAALC